MILIDFINEFRKGTLDAYKIGWRVDRIARIILVCAILHYMFVNTEAMLFCLNKLDMLLSLFLEKREMEHVFYFYWPMDGYIHTLKKLSVALAFSAFPFFISSIYILKMKTVGKRLGQLAIIVISIIMLQILYTYRNIFLFTLGDFANYKIIYNWIYILYFTATVLFCVIAVLYCYYLHRTPVETK